MTEDEYHIALNNIADSFGTLRDQVNHAFEVGRKVGLDDMQIGNDIRVKLRGLVSPATIRAMLPDAAKHQETVRKDYVLKSSTSQPNIPPPPQVVREAETETQGYVVEREPPKAIYDEPIHIPDREVILACRKFSTEIRIGLLNNAVLKLKVDKSNNVISIS